MTSQLLRTKLLVAIANSTPAPAQALAQTLQANERCSCDVGAKVSFRSMWAQVAHLSALNFGKHGLFALLIGLDWPRGKSES
ncbi:hypothetical protein QQF64_032833 [Cirrhinus molitorella]|uniref:Secreted protein n=1 Tax=Cirrhinus molitorella TaxID=172907 RepID=A0ABR3MS78_9TELE